MTIQNVDVPQGMKRVNGLYVPEDLEESAQNLSAGNKELLGLKEKLKVGQLQGTVMHALLEAGRDENGKTYDVGRISRDQFMKIVIESASYHVHVTHFGMPEGLAKQLSTYSDENDQEYIGLGIAGTVGFDQLGLEEMLEEAMIDNQTASQTAMQLGRSYLSIQASKKLKKDYKGDDALPKMKDNLNNLGKVFKLIPDEFKEKDLMKLPEHQDVSQLYIKSLNKAWGILG